MMAGARGKLLCKVLLALAICSGANGGERVLEFPSGWSLGRVEIRDDGPEGEVETFFHWIRTGPQWEYLCQARGQVRVPAGKRVRLVIRDAHRKDLSVLARLAPDDLYGLSLWGGNEGKGRIEERCVEVIGGLSGLRHLDLMCVYVPRRAMRHLVKLRNLEWLVTPCDITNAGFKYVCRIRLLKGLYLKGNQITEAGLENLANLSELRELGFGGQKLTGESVRFLAGLPKLEYLSLSVLEPEKAYVHLKKMASLRILLCAPEQVADGDLVNIGQIKGLERLSLYDSFVTDEGLPGLLELRSLKTLNLRKGVGNPTRGKITDASMPHITMLKSLEHLELPNTGITDAGMRHIEQLDKLKYLWVGGQSNSPLTDNAARYVSRLKLLEELLIGANSFTDDGLKEIAALKNLRKLNLSCARHVTDEGIKNLTGLHSLESLKIDYANVSISGVSALGVLKNLKHLNIDYVGQDNSGLDISGLTKLEELRLGMKSHVKNRRLVPYESLRDEDMASVGRLVNLRELGVSCGSVTEARFAQLSRLTNLEKLGISSESLTDENLKYLAGMKKMRQLSLNCSVTGEGLKYLEGLDRLEVLSIRCEEACARSAVERLRSQLPDCFMFNISPIDNKR